MMDSTIVYRLVADPTGQLFHSPLRKYAIRKPLREDIVHLHDGPIIIEAVFCHKALEKLAKELTRHPYSRDQYFGWSGSLGVDGKTCYGHYRLISRHEIETRPYVLSYLDYKPSFHWLDVLHDPASCDRRANSVPMIPII